MLQGREPVKLLAPHEHRRTSETFAGAVGWDRGEPNSTNRSWRGAIDTVLDAMASREPRFALVAGDTWKVSGTTLSFATLNYLTIAVSPRGLPHVAKSAADADAHVQALAGRR